MKLLVGLGFSEGAEGGEEIWCGWRVKWRRAFVADLGRCCGGEGGAEIIEDKFAGGEKFRLQ
jgi:hypothetical protein